MLDHARRAYAWCQDLGHRVLLKTFVFLALLGAVYWNQTEGQSHAIRENKTAITQIESLAVRVCEATNTSNAQLVSYILQQIDRSEQTLPTLTYYKNHPEELEIALYNIRQQREETRDAFPQTECVPASPADS